MWYFPAGQSVVFNRESMSTLNFIVLPLFIYETHIRAQAEYSPRR
jgi:hypothetical protein